MALFGKKENVKDKNRRQAVNLGERLENQRNASYMHSDNAGYGYGTESYPQNIARPAVSHDMRQEGCTDFYRVPEPYEHRNVYPDRDITEAVPQPAPQTGQGYTADMPFQRVSEPPAAERHYLDMGEKEEEKSGEPEDMLIADDNIDRATEEAVVKTVRARIKDQFGERIKNEGDKESFRTDVERAINLALMDEGRRVRSVKSRDRIAKRILDLITGLGPLQDLFKQGYSEIMVTRYDKVFVEKDGKMVLSGAKFGSEEELRSIIDQMLAPLGRVINDSSPTVDGRLKDGSRFNAVIPPIAVDGTQLTIRRFPEKKITAEDYIRFGSCNQVILDFLKAAVQSKWNIIVSGGTGSGKTSLLNMMSNFLDYDPGLSVVTIEDSCELKINHPNVRRYETRNANASGAGEVTSRALVKNTMRVRPDVIIIGEIRDGTMADFLRLATSGHDGCMTTVHSNSPQELEHTVQVLFQMAKDYDFTENAISRLYCSAVDLVVQIKRCADHVRRITNISHVVGYGKLGAKELNIRPSSPDYDPQECYIRDIFVWKQTGVTPDGIFTGEYVPTGYVPFGLLNKAKANRVKIDRSIFQREKGPRDGNRGHGENVRNNQSWDEKPKEKEKGEEQ